MRDAAIDPLQTQQRPLLDEILQMQAAGLAGFMARARMLLLFDQDFLNPECIYGWNGAMAAALVRDMVAPEWEQELFAMVTPVMPAGGLSPPREG